MAAVYWTLVASMRSLLFYYFTTTQAKCDGMVVRSGKSYVEGGE